MDKKLFLDKTLGDPVTFPKLLASTTGVTLASIEIAASTTGYYTVIDKIYISCDSVPTDADFDINVVGYDKSYTVSFDELGVAGFTPVWSWMDFLDPNPATNTVAWWLIDSVAGLVLAPSGDSIAIKGRNASAGDNYVGTNAVALTINVHGRLIPVDVFH